MINSNCTFTPDRFPEIIVDFNIISECQPQTFYAPAETPEIEYNNIFINNKKVGVNLYDLLLEECGDDWECQIFEELAEKNNDY